MSVVFDGTELMAHKKESFAAFVPEFHSVLKQLNSHVSEVLLVH